ncbi:MAG: ComF family protein [Alphaproteobacteria bacterium]|nr:ComF family protein [Alphaproteobacteria bacterium]
MPPDRILHAGQRIGRTALNAALNSVLPPRCPSCGIVVEAQGTLCADCWKGLTLLAEPCCDRCGYPFPYAVPPGTLCGACTRQPPAYDRARAVFRYDDASRQLVLRFKHADDTYAAPFYGRWLARTGAGLLADTDLVAPVPLHRWRLLSRRYNQAALLARSVVRVVDRPLAVDLLQRVRHTPSQGRLSATARRRNIRGAFALRSGWRASVADRRIVLVDDVLTTAATVDECARVLRRAGAARIDVLTLARVIRPQ